MAKAVLSSSLIELWSDPKWRLNNLYKIKDENGKCIDFRMNEVQEELFDNLWYLNLILKSRQHGMTTFIQILMLDACLFTSNVSAGVIAHNREDAEAFFSNKIKFAYDNLPEELRARIPAKNDTANTLKFANGSEIRVGTSLRSGTFQYLHISEYGKICAKYPDKANEIRTGALNTVHAGNYIFIESTAEGREGHFYDMCKNARDDLREGRELTKLDFKLFFFPWWQDSRCQLDGEPSFTTKQLEYFAKLKAEGIELSKKQAYWYVKKSATQGEEMKREFPSTFEECFEASIEGAYLAVEMARLRERGGICRIPVLNVPVDTYWDLGVNDDMCISFVQDVGPERRFIDYYSNSGEGLEHYARILQERGYLYGRHYLPHDGSHRRLGFKAKSVQEMLEELGVRPTQIVPRIAFEKDGIEASRRMLPKCYFDEQRCDDLIKCLDSYRKEWDDVRSVWKDRPRHDWASHGYKSFETAAVALDKFLIEEDYYEVDTRHGVSAAGY